MYSDMLDKISPYILSVSVSGGQGEEYYLSEVFQSTIAEVVVLLLPGPAPVIHPELRRGRRRMWLLAAGLAWSPPHMR